jgi:hypothetical protein
MSLILSVTVNTFIKGIIYSSVDERDDIDEESTSGIILTAVGVILISNMIPFTLGAIIGLYAIL